MIIMKINNKLYIINRIVLIVVLIMLYINPLERNINIKYLTILFVTAALLGSFSQLISFKSTKRNNKLIILLYTTSCIIIGFMIVSYIFNVSFLVI